MKNVYMLVLTTALVHALTFVSASPLTDGGLASDDEIPRDLKDLDYNGDVDAHDDDSVDVMQVSEPMESEDPLKDDADNDVPLSENGGIDRRGWLHHHLHHLGHIIHHVFHPHHNHTRALIHFIFHPRHYYHRNRRVLEEDSYETAHLYGSTEEVKPYRAAEKFNQLLNSKVVRSDLLVRLLDVTNPKYSSAVDGKQYGVIATLVDGRRVFLFKDKKEGQEAKTIMMFANNLSDEWRRIKSKVLSGSNLKLHHFLTAGEEGSNNGEDNSLKAALRKMRLD